MIFADAFVDFGREFQVFIYVACMHLDRLDSGKWKTAVVAETQALSHGLADYNLGCLCFYQSGRAFSSSGLGPELRNFSNLIFRKEVSRNPYKHQPAVMTNVFSLESASMRWAIIAFFLNSATDIA